MTTQTGPLIPTRFGEVSTLPAVGGRTQGEQRVLVAASQRGLRAAGWLMDLARHHADLEAGSCLRGMAEATAAVLMAFNDIRLNLDRDQQQELSRLLDLHASPDGSLLAQRSGIQLHPADLTSVAALTAAVRTVVTMTSMPWERDLPHVLALIDHILDQAGADPT